MRVLSGPFEIGAFVLGPAGIIAFGIGASGAIVVPLLIASVVATLVVTLSDRA
jgi:hypothetical protein